jgi:hypothetical protein
MENRPFVTGILGLSMLLGWSGASEARPPRVQIGQLYCQCNCTTDAGTKSYFWEKKGSCAVNGHACTARIGGKTWSGQLGSCQICRGADGNVLDKCFPAFSPGQGGILDDLQTAPPRPPKKPDVK